jgi:hypothetical protein
MIVRMVHPKHGAMHAYDQTEVKRLQGYGWVIEEKPVVVDIDVPVVCKKRGRPAKAK